MCSTSAITSLQFPGGCSKTDKQDISAGYQDFPGFTGCLIKLKSTIWLAKDNPKPKPSKPSQREVPNPALHAILRPFILFLKQKSRPSRQKFQSYRNIYSTTTASSLPSIFSTQRSGTSSLAIREIRSCNQVSGSSSSLPIRWISRISRQDNGILLDFQDIFRVREAKA